MLAKDTYGAIYSTLNSIGKINSKSQSIIIIIIIILDNREFVSTILLMLFLN